MAKITPFLALADYVQGGACLSHHLHFTKFVLQLLNEIDPCVLLKHSSLLLKSIYE